MSWFIFGVFASSLFNVVWFWINAWLLMKNIKKSEEKMFSELDRIHDDFIANKVQ